MLLLYLWVIILLRLYVAKDVLLLGQIGGKRRRRKVNLLRLRHLFLLLFLGHSNYYFRLMFDYFNAAVALYNPSHLVRNRHLCKVDLALTLLEPLLFLLYSSVSDLRWRRLFVLHHASIFLLNQSTNVTAHEDLTLGIAVLEELLDCDSRLVCELVQQKLVG